MSKYETLIAHIAAAIKTNGTQAITGQILQNKLLEMVSELGAGFQFGGVITPDDTFNSAKYGDTKVVFLACTGGRYNTFGPGSGFTLEPGQVAIFSYDGAWKKSIISYYGNTQIYGVRHYFTNASPDLTRIGEPSLHQELPVQSLMRRCVVNDLGVVKYYLKADDSTKKEDGSAADLSGADGMVMVEIPAHASVPSTPPTPIWMWKSPFSRSKVLCLAPADLSLPMRPLWTGVAIPSNSPPW